VDEEDNKMKFQIKRMKTRYNEEESEESEKEKGSIREIF